METVGSTPITRTMILPASDLADAITSFRDEHECFSNFKGGVVRFENAFYRYSENAYQAAKTLDPRQRQWFQDPDLRPGDAKRAGFKLVCRPDWETIGVSGRLVKVEIMATILWDKFVRHPQHRRVLLSTGNKMLVEGNTHGDQIWGMTPDNQGNWVGTNWLGVLLMEVRQKLMYG